MLGKKKPESDNTPPVTNISKKLNVDGITLKKGDKRQSSSRMRLSENRELVKLPPLKDASVSVTDWFKFNSQKTKKSNFEKKFIFIQFEIKNNTKRKLNRINSNNTLI